MHFITCTAVTSPRPPRNQTSATPQRRERIPHLILVLHLDEEGKGKAHLGQLWDGHAVLRAVELRSVVIDVNDQDVEGGGDAGVGGSAVIVQLCPLHREKTGEPLFSRKNECKESVHGVVRDSCSFLFLRFATEGSSTDSAIVPLTHRDVGPTLPSLMLWVLQHSQKLPRGLTLPLGWLWPGSSLSLSCNRLAGSGVTREQVGDFPAVSI